MVLLSVRMSKDTINQSSLLSSDDLQVKNTYVQFLYHCYIDTQVDNKETFTKEYVWELFKTFMIDIEKVSFNLPLQILSVWYSVCLSWVYQKCTKASVWNIHQYLARHPALSSAQCMPLHRYQNNIHYLCTGCLTYISSMEVVYVIQVPVRWHCALIQ